MRKKLNLQRRTNRNKEPQRSFSRIPRFYHTYVDTRLFFKKGWAEPH